MILNGSGCLDALTAPTVALSLDAFVTKTVTPLPREGNLPVRIAETDFGMLNSIGLANPGIDDFLSDSLPRLAELELELWVSVGGFSAGEYAELCTRLDERDEIAGLELNVSCPNVAEPSETAAEIVAAARDTTSKPLYAKLSPTFDVAETARAVQAAGADGLTLINTIRGLALDERSLRPTLSSGPGGYSGPVLRPIALAAVYAAYRATGLPIVGLGGVESGRHGLELIAAGASAFALGTVLFRDPGAPSRIRDELATEAAALGLASPLHARGIAHESDLPAFAELTKYVN